MRLSPPCAPAARNLTDIAVLVVAADDGIMPQTVEAINHAKAANTTIIVAINKMDKPTANPEPGQASSSREYELVPEEWGGDTICVPVSALTGQGIDDLLEKHQPGGRGQRTARRNPNRTRQGRRYRGAVWTRAQGPVATDPRPERHAASGRRASSRAPSVGRVRVMRDDQGDHLKEAGPSMPVEITGLTEVPAAGDLFDAVEDEKLARELADRRAAEQKEQQFSSIPEGHAG